MVFAQQTDPAAIVRFMLAGDAYVTLQSRQTGARFAYRVTLEEARGTAAPPHVVSVMTAGDYSYLGRIFSGYSGHVYASGMMSKISFNSPCSVAFASVWRALTIGEIHPEFAVMTGEEPCPSS